MAGADLGKTEKSLAAVAGRVLTASIIVITALFADPAVAQQAVDPSTRLPSGPATAVTALHGMVVAQESRAAAIGRDVLQRGGNAVDAAVATAFALAVTLPRAGNLGGGGFMVLHLAKGGKHEGDKDKRDIAIDYRETAPAAATASMFLDAEGRADAAKSRDSALAIGVPGTVAGLALAHERFGSGRFSLADLIAPAIALARDGVPVEDDLFDSLHLAEARLSRWPSTARVLLPGGHAPPEHALLKQPDLADSLAAIGRDGPDAFYRGAIARKLVGAVQAAGGIITSDDLQAYRALIREPVRGTYRGYDIVSMPPPSSGGVHLIEMLNILEGFPLRQQGDGAASAHLLIEAMKLAYADRAEFLGDSDRVAVPIERLIAKDYAAGLRATIAPDRARPSAEIRPGSAARGEGRNTTHFSVIDADGNAVANTYTLNFNFGVGLIADGTGILLNNELDDFAAKPGAPNAFGLVGGPANAPAPGKRPLSSMTPTLVLKDGRVVLVTGSPGGSRIITTVLQVLVRALDFDAPIAQAVAAPRLHHQWLPDEVVVEPTMPPAIIEALRRLGHTVRIGPPSGSAHSIMVTREGLVGAADMRVRGASAQGY
jgi:gamma-glutamyltranspeptidase/glutathione hydrolase